MKLLHTALLGMTLVLAGCGSSGSSSDNENPPEQTPETGVFLDGPVINIEYRTETREGVTNDSGEYEYVEGETVTFFIGDLEFPPVTARGIVTPLDFAHTYETTDTTVVNIIRLLQTLDKDGNPDNGITITQDAKDSASPVDFDLSESQFEAASNVVDLVMNAGQDVATSVLVDTDGAVSHFEEQLTGNGISFGDVNGVWEFEDGTVALFLVDDWHLVVQWEEENGFIGFERGTYAVHDRTISFTTIQNNDGEALFCNEPSPYTCPEVTFDFSISDDVLTLTIPEFGPAVFDRASFSADTVQGLWNLPGESVVFIFLPGEDYLAVQWVEENNFIGFERGTYTVGGDEITFTTLQNHDGEALLCNEPSPATCPDIGIGFSIVDDELTLTIPEAGSFTFERLY